MTLPTKVFTFIAVLIPFGLGVWFPFPSPAQDGPLVSVFDKQAPEGLTDLLTIQRTAGEIARRAVPCTVSIEVGSSMGSGIVISEDGYVLTAAHVTPQPGVEVRLRFPDGRVVMGRSLGIHTKADAAIVKISEVGPWPFLPLIPAGESPRVGDWCLALGHTSGYQADRTPPVRIGRIIDALPFFIISDSPVNVGDSGGPLLDMQGRVIGVHSRITEDVSENYHVPGTIYREFWDELTAGEIYPKQVMSEFLELLDVDKNGRLTRTELKSDFQRRMFDRLVANFGLVADESLTIGSVVTDAFHWREPTRLSLDQLADLGGRSVDALDTPLQARGSATRRAFQGTLRNAKEITVRVRAGNSPIGLGMVVREDGYVVTKGTLLPDDRDLKCVLPSGDVVNAVRVTSSRDYDLVLLKIDADHLVAPEWSTVKVELGNWLVVPDVQGKIKSLGIASVRARSVPVTPPMMGVQVDNSEPNRAVVRQVFPRSGAADAGLTAGDEIIQVVDQMVSNYEQLRVSLQEYRAGDEVRIRVTRGGEFLDFQVVLGAPEDIFFDRRAWRLSGNLSRRRDGFPQAIQLDADLAPEFCGGPVIDATGKVAGIALARADRTATYVAPQEAIQPVIEQLLLEAQRHRDAIPTGTSSEELRAQ